MYRIREPAGGFGSQKFAILRRRKLCSVPQFYPAFHVFLHQRTRFSILNGRGTAIKPSFDKVVRKMKIKDVNMPYFTSKVGRDLVWRVAEMSVELRWPKFAAAPASFSPAFRDGTWVGFGSQLQTSTLSSQNLTASIGIHVLLSMASSLPCTVKTYPI